MEKYEIAVDARMINASGIGTYLQNILPAICSTYNTVLLGDRKELQPYKADVIEFSAPIYSIKELATLPFKIPACKVFWSPHFNVPIIALPAKHVVTTIHDVFHLAFFNTLNSKQKVYAKFFYNHAAKQSDAIITVSNFSKQEISKYTSAKAEQIKVIYNGVHQNTFARAFSATEAEEINRKYALPQRYILFVGNVKPHKNLITLIEALDAVLKKDENLFLVIVGKKDGFITGDHQVGKLIEDSQLLKERTQFTGFAEQEDLPFIYQRASLFVMPSLYEGFGLPPLEAMSANTLTAVSDQASLPEVCKNGALYFNPYDKKAIRHVIEKALNLTTEEETELKRKASEVSQSYSWEKARQEHIKLFNEYIL
ncbi:MAG: glycosyltransferase family 1 protein [Nitrospirota bacterium]